MHHISEYLTQSGNSMASLFTANPFGFLMKVGESNEVASRQSTDSGSTDSKTLSDLQVRMMMWEFEAYLSGHHKKESSSSDLGDERNTSVGVKPSKFQPFTSLVTSGKSNTFLKNHPGKRLKLEQLCGELHFRNSKKVMTEFRDCVLRANPPLKSEKMVELFEIILTETLEGQHEAEAAWRADPRNMNKLSTEYIGKKISRVLGSMSSLFAQQSGKIMPVVDFLLGTDDDGDDGANAHHDDTQAEATFTATDSEVPRSHDRVIKRGAQELERRRGAQSQSHCKVLVNDETQIRVEGEKLTSCASGISHPTNAYRQPVPWEYSDCAFAPQIDRNTNNCGDTGYEMENFSENIISDQVDKKNLLEKEVKFKFKPGKIKRRVAEGALSSQDIYVDVQL